MKYLRSLLLVAFCVSVFGCISDDSLRSTTSKSDIGQDDKKLDFFHQTFGVRSGVDSRAREIEERLGL